NQNRVNCDLLDTLPDGPIKDALQEACRDQTGEPPPQRVTAQGPVLDPIDKAIDCTEGTRKAKRQLRRLGTVDLPPSVLDQLVKPLKKNLRKLARECDELKEEITGEDGILDALRGGVGDIPDLDVLNDSGVPLTGIAAGGAVTGTSPPSVASRIGDWFGGFFAFLGWGS
ncbi:MAG: hypothetical protein LC808_18585, partial [Actinobacteria bacterium]|nr:hypothetical protein [Actinomycetota bacterium]